MPAKPKNEALAAVRAAEAKRKPARRGSRPSGGGGFGAWETVEEFGDWRLPAFHPTRPCPQCGQPASPDVGRDNSLGSYWACVNLHRFAVGPEDARLCSCIEEVEITTTKGAKRSGPCTAKLQSLGRFLVCPRHQRAVWPRQEGVSPITLCSAGIEVAGRLARFTVEAGDPYALRDGEVPFGYDEDGWAVALAANPDLAASRPRFIVTPSDDDGGVAASPAPLSAPVAAPAEVMALFTAPPAEPRRPSGDGHLFPIAEVPVEVARKRIDALSPSSATALHECPRRFEESKVLGKKEPPGRAATLGKFVHKVLELLTALPLEERTESAAREIARRLWADVDRDPEAPVEYGDADESDVRELRRDRIVLNREVADVGGWIRHFKGESWAAIAYAVSIEEAYGGEVAYRELNLWHTTSAGVPFRGYADRVDRHDTRHRKGLIVNDYKSGRAPVTTYVPRGSTKRLGDVDDEKLAEKAEQLIWYWAPIEQKTKELTGDDEPVVGAVLAYIGAGAQTVLWVDDSRRPEAEAKLRRLWSSLQRYERDALASGERYPTKDLSVERNGYLCGWCPFFADCPEGSAWLLDHWAWMEKRDAKGEPVPAKVTVDAWPREKRQAWREMARSA